MSYKFSYKHAVRAEGVKKRNIKMNLQDAWKHEVMSSLNDSQMWETIKNKPIEERVSLVLQTFSKMYQQTNHPYEIIASFVSDTEKNLSPAQLKRMDNKKGKDFVRSVIGLVKEYVESTIINEIDSIRKSIKE